MIKAYEEGYDVVSARRTRTGEKPHRTFLAKHFYRLANKMMDIELMDGVSEFRLFSRKAVSAILHYKNTTDSLKEFLLGLALKKKSSNMKTKYVL